MSSGSRLARFSAGPSVWCGEILRFVEISLEIKVPFVLIAEVLSYDGSVEVWWACPSKDVDMSSSDVLSVGAFGGTGREAAEEAGDLGETIEKASEEQTWCSSNENLFLQPVISSLPRQWDSTSIYNKALLSSSMSSPRGMCLQNHGEFCNALSLHKVNAECVKPDETNRQ